MIYCVSDIHGCFDEFVEILEKIGLRQSDTLYILGDVVDRGPDSVKCLELIMEMPNVRMLAGNHEYMMLNALRRDRDETSFVRWHDRNGGNITLAALNALPPERRGALLDYTEGLPYFFEVNAEGRDYFLVHAGLKLKPPGKKHVIAADGQTEYDMVWIREEFYAEKGLPGRTVVFGHTPVGYLWNDMKNSGIWHDPVHGDKICIDGGCVFGGSLNALRLDDLWEFYTGTGERA